MIDVKQATEIARTQLIDLLGKQELADKNGITLEEFELSDNGKYWNITLGYPVRETHPVREVVKGLSPLLHEPRKRFKTFRIATRDGKLVAMKYVEQ
jgi:hypothetical protein